MLPGGWEEGNGSVSLAGVSLLDLADRYGTPLYVVDEDHIRRRLAAFRTAFGPEAILVYAGKAGLYGALARILTGEGWWIDAVSAGEIELALRAGCPAERILVHGNAKPPEELARAVTVGVGRIVIDHAGELEMLSRLASDAAGGVPPRDGKGMAVLVRLNADVAALTHAKVKTTGAAAQFGMDAEAAARAARAVSELPGLRAAGVHIHVGSQIRDVDTFRRAAEAAVAFIAGAREAFEEPVDLDLGGGLAVPYLDGDPAPSPSAFAEAIERGLEAASARRRIGPFRLLVEPGRSVVANAGLTLYRVRSRKRLADGRTVVAVDGGLSDNPRPSLYGQRYEVRSVSRAVEPHATFMRVVGRHCETGDLISDGAPLPVDTAPDDVVAVPATGAYAYSMSSRYNGLPRPGIVFVRNGRAREVVRRETLEDLWACDLELEASQEGC